MIDPNQSIKLLTFLKISIMKTNYFFNGFVLCLFSIFNLFSMQAQNHPFAGGDGSSRNPYLIVNPVQFDSIRNYKSMKFKLTADLDFSNYIREDGTKWKPIGDAEGGEWWLQTNEGTFTGVFDGGGHVIKNLHVETEGGLMSIFGVCAFSSIVNLIVMDCSIKGTGDFAMIATYVADCEFDQIAVINCNIEGNGNFIGGILARPWRSTITNCYSVGGSVKGDAGIGGIAGFCEEGNNISYCYSTTAIEGKRAVGGISGGITTSNIMNCVALNISITSDPEMSAGRVCGEKHNACTIDNNYAIANLKINGNVIENENTGLLTLHGENVSDEEVQTVNFWGTKAQFSIEEGEDQIWIMNKLISNYPIFLNQTVTSIYNLKSSNNKVINQLDGFRIEGLKNESQIYIYNSRGDLSAKYNNVTSGKLLPFTQRGVFLIKVVSSDINVEVLKIVR